MRPGLARLFFACRLDDDSFMVAAGEVDLEPMDPKSRASRSREARLKPKQK